MGQEVHKIFKYVTNLNYSFNTAEPNKKKINLVLLYIKKKD